MIGYILNLVVPEPPPHLVVRGGDDDVHGADGRVATLRERLATVAQRGRGGRLGS